jgi:plasmid stabilization system protein ParE
VVEEVVWSNRAINDFNKVIAYLLENWSEKEVGAFIRATERTVGYIIEHPKMFRSTAKRNVHEALITRHNLMRYHVAGSHIHILTIWDTRQHPRTKLNKTR